MYTDIVLELFDIEEKFRKCSGSEVNSKEQHPWGPVLPPSGSPFCPPRASHTPLLPYPALPGTSPRAAALCADSVWSSESLPPGGCHAWHPQRSSPHSLSGHRGAPHMAHDMTWGPVTAPRRVVVRPVETKPRTESGRPSSPPCPGTWLWFQTCGVRKACLACQTLKSCLST